MKEKIELRKEVFDFMKQQGLENKLSLNGGHISYYVVNHLIASFYEYKTEQVKNYSIPVVVGQSEQFTPKQLWKMAQKYNADDFIKIVKEIEG